jgi:hypothetical protein
LPDSVPIPLDVLAETQAALDCALALAEESPEAYGKVAKARANLDAVINEKSVETPQKSDTIQRRSELKKVRDELLTLARRLEKVEKAA